MKKQLLEKFGLSPNASWQEVRIKYKKLAMRYHPDKNLNDPAAAEAFKEIQNIYEELDKIFNPHKKRATILEDFEPSNEPDLSSDGPRKQFSSVEDAINKGGSFSEIKSILKRYLKETTDSKDLADLLFWMIDNKKVSAVFIKKVLKKIPQDYLKSVSPSDFPILFKTFSNYPNDFILIYELLKKGVSTASIDYHTRLYHKNPIGHFLWFARFNTIKKNWASFLISYGAKVDDIGTDDNGDSQQTLLHYAINSLKYIHEEYNLLDREFNRKFYLSSIRTLLLYGVDLQVKDSKCKQSALALVKNIASSISPGFFSSKNTSLKICLSEEEKVAYLKALKEIERIICCKLAFEKAAELIKLDKDAYEKYLIIARDYDKNLYEELINKFMFSNSHLIKQKNLLNKLWSLPIIHIHAKEDADALSLRLKNSEEKEYIKIEKKVSDILSDTFPYDYMSYMKWDAMGIVEDYLLKRYDKLIQSKQKEIISFSSLVSEAEKRSHDKKTAKINHWDASFWQSIKRNNNELNEAIVKIEQGIKKLSKNEFLDRYESSYKNMNFFNNYVMDSITDTVKHNRARVAYCLHFMQKMTWKFDEPNTNNPSIDLLNNLYILKGVLLAEVHSQSYFQNLFNCAMTSRLNEYVEHEISNIELRLREEYRKTSNGINIDKDIKIQSRRAQLVSLTNAYGTRWQRFKTALLGDKSKIQIAQELNTVRNEALHMMQLR